MSVELEHIRLYPTSLRSSDEEAPSSFVHEGAAPVISEQVEATVEATVQPAVNAVVTSPPPERYDVASLCCCILLWIAVFCFTMYAGYLSASPCHIVCDSSPVTRWLAGVATATNPTCQGTFYTQVLLAPAPDTLVFQCSIDVAMCRNASDALILGQEVSGVFVCHNQCSKDDLTCATRDESHTLNVSTFGVVFALFCFGFAAFTLLITCAMIHSLIVRARAS
jgi:hypothetical protein